MSLRTRTTLAATLSAAALAASGLTGPIGTASAAPDTVTIRGYVFQFSYAMFRGVLPGAVVDAEVNGKPANPSVVTPVVADADGYYEIEVPDDADVSLFATVPEAARPMYDLDGPNKPLPSVPMPFHTTYNQTFHTSGDDLDFVTVQVPAEPVVKGIAEGFYMKVRGDLAPFAAQYPDVPELQLGDGYGALSNGTTDICAVASTVYRADKRLIIDRSGDQHAPTHREYFDIFYANPPHGRDGATVDPIEGAGIFGMGNPMYFNEQVNPDPAEKHSSKDGGVLWMNVPTGTHTVTAHKAGTRFASADITCQPGRFVNASPQWGLYELMPGEQTHPATITGVTLALPAKAAFGSTVTARVAVGGGAAADGLVALEVDGRQVATGTVTDGRASVKLPASFAPGTHRVVARYAPTGTIPTRSSDVVSLVTTKAPSRIKVSGRDRGRKTVLTARVRAQGFTPSGKVQFYVGGKKAGKPVRLKAGTAATKVRSRKKLKVRVVYLGNSTTGRSSARVVIRAH